MRLIHLLLLFLIFTACETPVDVAAEKAAILRLHQAQKDFHFARQDSLLVAQFADTLLTVSNGTISRTSKAENRDRFHNYFSKVEFVKWEDQSPPVIQLSADGSMAYVVVDKEVVVTYEDDSAVMIEETVDFAWVAIYRKKNGAWKLECMASTNQPERIKSLGEN